MRVIGRLALAALLSAMVAPPAASAPPDPGAIAATLVNLDLVPRHRALAQATRDLAAAATRFCDRPDAIGLDRVTAAYNAAADAWIGVEPVGFGPIELRMRSPRLYFWPDPTGRAERDVGEFLTTGDTAILEPLQFAGQTVSLQGLPAAEAVLYDTGAADHLLAGDDEGKLRCALLRAIAGNVAELAGGLFADWTQGEHPFVRTLATPGADNPDYASQAEVTAAFLKSINHALQLAVDTRLKPVLGPGIDAARPDRAEARGSGRSLRNIILGLESAQRLYLGPNGTDGLEALAAAGAADPEIAALLRKAFGITIETARGVAKPLDIAVLDPAERPKLEKLATQIQALRQLIGTRLAAALGLSLGFNALDGD